MPDLVFFVVGLVVIVAVIATLWLAGTMALTPSPANPRLRTVIVVALLLLSALALWLLFGGYASLLR